MMNSNSMIRAKSLFRYVSRVTVFIAFILTFGIIQGSEGREWHSKHFQLRSELIATNNYLRIDGKQVRSDGGPSSCETFISISNTIDDNWDEIVILEGVTGKVIAIDQKSDAIIAKNPLKTISSYNSLHEVMSAEPEILFKKIARSKGSELYYFKSLLKGCRRIIGFNRTGDALPTSRVNPGSDESLFRVV